MGETSKNMSLKINEDPTERITINRCFKKAYPMRDT